MKSRIDFLSDKEYEQYCLKYASIMAMQGILASNSFESATPNGQKYIATASVECAKEILKQLEQENK